MILYRVEDNCSTIPSDMGLSTATGSPNPNFEVKVTLQLPLPWDVVVASLTRHCVIMVPIPWEFQAR